MEVALCGGNTRRANRALKGKGLEIPRTTLRKWAQTQHAERYDELRREVIPRVHDRMAQESEDLALEYAEAERETISRYRDGVPELKPAEAAGAARNMATSRGIATDKALLLRGKPNSISATTSDTGELYNALRRLGVEIIDSDAEEIEDTQIDAECRLDQAQSPLN